jgi:hypothetical protein
MPCKASPFIPTEKKVAYIQSLLRVGFDRLILGVLCHQAIPQMQDTAAVLSQLIYRKQKNYWPLLPIPEVPNSFNAC